MIFHTFYCVTNDTRHFHGKRSETVEARAIREMKIRERKCIEGMARGDRETARGSNAQRRLVSEPCPPGIPPPALEFLLPSPSPYDALETIGRNSCEWLRASRAPTPSTRRARHLLLRRMAIGKVRNCHGGHKGDVRGAAEPGVRTKRGDESLSRQWRQARCGWGYGACRDP